MDSRENSESKVSEQPAPKQIDFLTGLKEDGFDVGEMEKTLSDKWVEVNYTLNDPSKLGIKAPKGQKIGVSFFASRGLDAEKDKQHTLIKDVRFVGFDGAKMPKVKRTSQANLGPIKRSEVEPHPFRKFPRNWPCFCGSGKKFKKCHMDEVPQWIMKNQAPQVKAMFKQYMAAFGDNPKDIQKVQKELEH